MKRTANKIFGRATRSSSFIEQHNLASSPLSSTNEREHEYAVYSPRTLIPSSRNSRSDTATRTVKLNHDILVIIMDVIGAENFNSKDLLSTMLTCRACYKGGIPILLRRPVYLFAANIKSFCDYMFNDLGFRAPLLHYVELKPRNLSSSLEDLRRLAFVLRKAYGLQVFRASESEATFESVPEMADALAALPQLIELGMWSAGNRAITLFQQLSNKLVRVSASLRDEVEFTIPPLNLPLLEELTLRYISIEYVTGSCPALKSLELDAVSANDWTLASLVRLCPNLRNLVVWRLEMPDDLEIDEVAEARAANEDYRDSSSNLWKELDRVEGPAETLFALAFPCRIKNLHLSQCALDSEHFSTWLATLIVDCRPQHLSMAIDTNQLDFSVFADCATLSIAAPYLISFQMTITVCDDFNAETDSNKLLDCLLGFIQCSSLEMVEIHLLGDTATLYRVHPDLMELRYLLSSTFARRVFDAVGSPALHHITLAGTGRPRAHWKINSNGTFTRV